MKTKVCKSKKFPELACGLIKPADQFNKCRSLCKDCGKKYIKIYQEEHKEEIKNRNKKYQEEHKEELKEYNHKYYEENKEEIIENAQIFYRENKENKKEYDKQYRRDSKEKINKLKRAWEKEKRENDFGFVIRCNISRQINHALKKINSSKNGFSSWSKLGYDPQTLRNYLLNHPKKEAWMSAENYGSYNAEAWDDADPSTWTWNIDHIIPQSDLPYSSMEDENFKKCWALTNLRPYSAKQNCLDGINKTRHHKKNNVI